jgi:hypothetical protein
MTKTFKQQPRIITIPSPPNSGPGVGNSRDAYSARREGYIDHDLGERRLSEREAWHHLADEDRQRQLRMPLRRVTGSHKPNRIQEGEPGQFARKVRT